MKSMIRDTQDKGDFSHPVRETDRTSTPSNAVTKEKIILPVDPMRSSSGEKAKMKGMINPDAASFIAAYPVSHIFDPAIPAAAKVDKATGGVIVESAPKYRMNI